MARGRPRITHNILRDENVQVPVEDRHLTNLTAQGSSGSRYTMVDDFGSKAFRGGYKGHGLDKITRGGKKAMVYIGPGDNLAPVGENATKLKNKLGFIVKSTAKSAIRPWKEVVREHSHEMWALVTQSFEVSNESPPKFKILEDAGKIQPDGPGVKETKFINYCFNQMQSTYGKWKSELHMHYKAFESDEERKRHIPLYCSESSWEAMMNLFDSEEFKRKSAIYSNNRAQQIMRQSTGPVSFIQVEYDMMDDNTGERAKPSDFWRTTHVKKKGNGLDFHDHRSKENFLKLVDAEQGDNRPANFDDLMAITLGSKAGYIVGKGKGYKTSKSYHGSTCKPAVTEELEQLRSDVNEAKTQLNEAKDLIVTQADELKKMQCFIQEFMSQNGNKNLVGSSRDDDSETQPPSQYGMVYRQFLEDSQETTFPCVSPPPNIRQWFPSYQTPSQFSSDLGFHLSNH